MIESRTIFREGLKEIFWAPITWVPLIPSMGIIAFCSLPWWANGGLLLAPTAFIVSHWLLFWPRLSKVIEGRMLLEQQESQEQELATVLQKMQSGGYPKEASLLGKARSILDAISQINQTSASTEQSLRIEAVSRELYAQMLERAKAALAGKNKDTECLASFQKSSKTMLDSLELIRRQADAMAKITTGDPNARLSQLEETLRSENTIAGNVIERFENDTKASE